MLHDRFAYSSSDADAVVTMFSGLNGSGTLLASFNLSANATNGCADSSYCHFDVANLAFALRRNLGKQRTQRFQELPKCLEAARVATPLFINFEQAFYVHGGVPSVMGILATPATNEGRHRMAPVQQAELERQMSRGPELRPDAGTRAGLFHFAQAVADSTTDGQRHWHRLRHERHMIAIPLVGLRDREWRALVVIIASQYW